MDDVVLDIPRHTTELKAALERLKNLVHKTPVMTSHLLDDRAGCKAFVKCEPFQKTGSFKIRGAMNSLLCLAPEERSRGVTAHSSGNHAAALACAARTLNVPCTVVMPKNAIATKIAATRSYGATVVFCDNTTKAREDATLELVRDHGMTPVHPYDHWPTIYGAGTSAMELLEEVPDLDYIYVPVGGGGLMSGTTLAAKAFSNAKVIACEPSKADDAYRSFKSGEMQGHLALPDTIADGLRTCIGTIPFNVMRAFVTDVVTVTDEEILEAMRFIWERMKILVEPSSCTVIAALLKDKERVAGKRVGLILSGGNVEVEELLRALQK